LQLELHARLGEETIDCNKADFEEVQIQMLDKLYIFEWKPSLQLCRGKQQQPNIYKIFRANCIEV
jgi:hypothetical protein